MPIRGLCSLGIKREKPLEKLSVATYIRGKSNSMGNKMKKIILTVLCGLFVALEAHAASASKEDVSKVENYLNSIKTLSADFIQIASNGEQVEGHLYVEKPNKIRMEYKAPSNVLIVGNGDYIVYYDKELDQVTNIDYDDIPAAMVLANTVKIGKDLKVTDFVKDPGMTRMSLKYNNSGDLGPFTLVFSNSPFELKQWKVITPQSLEVSLSLYDTVVDSKLDDDLFKFSKRQASKKKYNKRK